jgi:hypothetical protein
MMSRNTLFESDARRTHEHAAKPRRLQREAAANQGARALIEPGKDSDAGSDAKVPPSLAKLLDGKSDETVANIVAMLVVHIRPVLAEIFMAARSAIELGEDTGEAQGGAKLDAKGRIIFSALFGAIQFSSVQAMVGEAHASSLLFWVFWVYGGSFAGAGRSDIGGGRRESS